MCDTKKEEILKAELLNICIEDRFRYFKQKNIKIPFEKRINVDLLVKFVWMILQSFGKKRNVKVLFVDEVRNKSMFENLYATIENCPHEYVVINFGSSKSRYTHAKVGFVMPMLWLLAALVVHACLYICLPFVGWEKINKKSSSVLIFLFQSYLKKFSGEDVKMYCMSDHHFYSTVACCNRNFETHTIQHGIVMDMSYYYPIRADHFLAWGEHTKKVQYDDPKVQVTGTYKFSKLRPQNNKDTNKSVLYCISISDNKVVSQKIHAILPIVSKMGYVLKVKMHPGSMFNETELKNSIKEKKLEFYKECLLSDITFDVAIIENSTVLVDLLFLNKPFVIFDERGGYFSVYGESIPWCETSNELENAINKAFGADNVQIRDWIMQQELNGGECTIWE